MKIDNHTLEIDGKYKYILYTTFTVKETKNFHYFPHKKFFFSLRAEGVNIVEESEIGLFVLLKRVKKTDFSKAILSHKQHLKLFKLYMRC